MDKSRPSTKAIEIEESLKKRFAELEMQLSEKTVSPEQLYAWFKEEILRKEAQITHLRQENEILFKTALKTAEHDVERKHMGQHHSKGEDTQKNT